MSLDPAGTSARATKANVQFLTVTFSACHSIHVQDRIRVQAQEDHHLMRAVRNGEVGKLATLYSRHQRPLFNFFLRLTGSRPTSEDLVQDVFTRILKYRT